MNTIVKVAVTANAFNRPKKHYPLSVAKIAAALKRA